MPQCILSSSMWIAQQSVAQTQCLMPTVFAFNLQITSSSKLASPILEDKMKPNKNKCFSEQRLGFSNGISKLGTLCHTDHTAVLCKREYGSKENICLLSFHTPGAGRIPSGHLQPVHAGGGDLAFPLHFLESSGSTGNLLSMCFAVSSK